MDYDFEYIKNILPKRPQNGHKGIFGHVLNIAGSGFYVGAAYFSSIVPLKVGCGKVTLASVEQVLNSVSALSPDIILKPVAKGKTIPEKALKQIASSLSDFSVISIGCGLSNEKTTCKFFKNFIKILPKINKPIVIDADGLNILSQMKNVKLSQNVVLTPHPKELSRLLNVPVDNILSQPEFWVNKCCEKYDCITILKLHNTIISDNNGHTYINNTGNTALSHGGSGDVLTGMLSGFLAQGLNCFDTAVLSVYLHGLAAEIASEELTEYSVLASDLFKYISKAIKKISDK